MKQDLASRAQQHDVSPALFESMQVIFMTREAGRFGSSSCCTMPMLLLDLPVELLRDVVSHINPEGDKVNLHRCWPTKCSFFSALSWIRLR